MEKWRSGHKLMVFRPRGFVELAGDEVGGWMKGCSCGDSLGGALSVVLYRMHAQGRLDPTKPNTPSHPLHQQTPLHRVRHLYDKAAVVAIPGRPLMVRAFAIPQHSFVSAQFQSTP